MTVIDAMQKPDLEQLVCQHQAGVWRYLRYLGCDEAEADDLTQETFLAVIKDPLEIRSPAQTIAYLRTVARNRMLMARRKSGREIAMAQLDQAEQVWASSPASNGWGDYLDTLADCMQSAVDQRKREVLDLQYRQGVSRESIAERLGMTPDGVKTLLRRARAALRDCVERKHKP